MFKRHLVKFNLEHYTEGPEIMLQHVAQAWEGEEQVHRTRLGISGNQPW